MSGYKKIMADKFSKETRSKIMSKIRNKNTRPEIKIRKLLYCSGHKGYRLNYKKASGKPDICYVGKKIAIFIDGCFWHGCPKCYKRPKSNKKYWSEKIKINKKRDKKVNLALKKENWTVLRFWECQVNKKTENIFNKIDEVLKDRCFKIQ